MGRIVVTEFVSLDGVMEAPGGEAGHRDAGWTFQFERGEGDAFKLRETLDADALLLGRVTYEGFAVAWPEREGEFADKFNTMPKFVVSSTLAEAPWSNSTVIGANVAESVASLREDFDGELLVAGSRQLVQALVEHDLIDELRLMVFPLLLGSGRRLFGETSAKKLLSLQSSQVVGEGVQILVYTRA